MTTPTDTNEFMEAALRQVFERLRIDKVPGSELLTEETLQIGIQLAHKVEMQLRNPRIRASITRELVAFMIDTKQGVSVFIRSGMSSEQATAQYLKTNRAYLRALAALLAQVQVVASITEWDEWLNIYFGDIGKNKGGSDT